MGAGKGMPERSERLDTDSAARIEALAEELAAARQDIECLRAQITELRTSLSWQITAPLRWGLGLSLSVASSTLTTLRRRRARWGDWPSSRSHAAVVSCLCVTRNRVELLSRAIDCFLAQTHAARELVIVYEDDDPATRGLLSRMDDRRIRVIEVPSALGLPLGALRNLAIDAARGRWFCQWDDDDWHHPERLAVQWRALRASGKAACVLTRWLIYDVVSQRGYLSETRDWEGSLLCDRSAIDANHRYPPRARGEDTDFVAQLIARDALTRINRPDLYVYVHHGANTWDQTHWDTNIMARSTPLDRTHTQAIRRQLKNAAQDPSAPPATGL